MKKHILATALVLASSTAFATKARQKSLGNSFHLSGTQTVYTSPYHLFSIDNFVSVEAGLTTSTTVDNGAEGSGMFNVNENSRLFMSIGHLDESVQTQRKFLNALAGVTAYKTQQNPIEAIYAWKADGTTWGLGLNYSDYKNKVTNEAETSTGVRVAASYGAFKWKLNTGLVNKATNTAGDTFDNQPYYNLGLRYQMDTLRFGFDYTGWTVKQTLNGATTANQEHQFQGMNVRVTDVQKVDKTEYFYGVTLDQSTFKDKIADKKFTRLTAPVLIGAETHANDWLIVRGSVVQTVLIAQSKDEVGYPAAAVTGATGTVDGEFAAEANNTAVNVGLGLKLNKVQVDATLSGLSGSTANQKVDGTNLLAQVGVVYKY